MLGKDKILLIEETPVYKMEGKMKIILYLGSKYTCIHVLHCLLSSHYYTLNFKCIIGITSFVVFRLNDIIAKESGNLQG